MEDTEKRIRFHFSVSSVLSVANQFFNQHSARNVAKVRMAMRIFLSQNSGL